jgi:hypothetical protein
MTKRGGGNETWNRLNTWTDGQAPAERLAAQILHVDGFVDIDPVHPLGGRDGLKDIVCEYKGKKYIGAVYFPRGQKSFTELKTKFLGDLEGVERNEVDGIAFVTNQEITLGEREALEELAGTTLIEIYHLERIVHILDTPQCYGIRQEYLSIDVSKDELSALLAENKAAIEKNQQLLEENRTLMNDLKTVTERMLNVVENPNFLKAEDTMKEVKVLRAIRLLLSDPYDNNINTYRSLAVFLHESLERAVPILIQSPTFDDFVENSTRKKLVIKELSRDLHLDKDKLISVSHSMAFPPAIEPGSDNHMIVTISQDKQLELNQVAYKVHTFVHEKLLKAVRSPD